MSEVADKLFWDQLLQLIAEGHVVPVIGRDLLLVRDGDRLQALYPLLAQRLANYLDMPADDLPRGSEINTVVCRYIASGNRVEDIYPALKVIMPRADELSLPDSLRKLASIPSFKLFVSTTFDDLMARSLDALRHAGKARTEIRSYAPNAVEDLPFPLSDMAGPLVYHLFGKLSAVPSYAVTQEDTLEFLHSLQSEARQPHILFDELNRANLLLLGCGYGGWLGRFFLRTAKRQRLLEARGNSDYIADATMGNDSNLVLFLRHFSARTRLYDSGDAVEFVEQLHRRWFERYPAPADDSAPSIAPCGDDSMEAGAVFLSYASEDRPAVIKIKDALEAAGVDVFFDKQDLQVGDDFEVKLMQNIANCSLFLPVISQHTLTAERRFFRMEWVQALEEERKVMPTQTFLLPVVIDSTSPENAALPKRFRDLHWQQLPEGETTPEFVDTIRELYRKYQKLIARSA